MMDHDKAVAHAFITERLLAERVVTGRGGERTLFLPEATRLARVALEALADAKFVVVTAKEQEEIEDAISW